MRSLWNTEENDGKTKIVLNCNLQDKIYCSIQQKSLYLSPKKLSFEQLTKT